ncbi:hypothetical protein AB0M20_45350, partial [Actinoplanes sp. NPDC051633]|uniref:hypothetical protein n=1 Tax=Actinoplanes sp. NPDC051633 TaxID=3155670 RepID=UPI00341CE9CF
MQKLPMRVWTGTVVRTVNLTPSMRRVVFDVAVPRKFLVGMSYVLANYVSELVGGLLGLIPTKY